MPAAAESVDDVVALSRPFTDRIPDIAKRVNEENTITKEDTEIKRALYVETELLRMDYEDIPVVDRFLHRYHHTDDKEAKNALAQTEEGKIILRACAEFDELSLSQRIPHNTKKVNKFKTFFRLLLLVVYIIICIPPMSFISLFLYTHPILCSLGIKQYQPVDIVNRWFARGFLFVCGVTVTLENEEFNDESNSNVIGMFTHASNLDPLITISGSVAYKFIAKKSLFQIPVIGWILGGFGHIPIDRSNLVVAKASLSAALGLISRYHRSIAISPEGTRSKTGRLSHFKKGPFHTAIDAKLPIVPAIVEGAFQLWPPQAIIPNSGSVNVKYLSPILVRDDDTYETLSRRVRREILKGTLRASTTSTTAKPKQRQLHLAIYAAFFPFFSAVLIFAIVKIVRSLLA